MPPPARPAVPALVLFDMDDTLFDHRFAVRRALAQVRREDSRLSRRPLGRLIQEYDRLLEAVHPDVLAGRTTHAEARLDRFRQLFSWAGAAVTPREAEELARRYRAVYQASRRPVSGAPELLRWLGRRSTIGIVSNNHTTEQKDKLRALGMESQVDFLLTSEDAGVEKPDPGIFRRAIEIARAEPDDAVMVGDNWEADIAGAMAAGIRPVWLNRLGQSQPLGTLPVAELRALRPVRDVVRRLAANDGRSGGPPHR